MRWYPMPAPGATEEKQTLQEAGTPEAMRVFHDPGEEHDRIEESANFPFVADFYARCFGGMLNYRPR